MRFCISGRPREPGAPLSNPRISFKLQLVGGRSCPSGSGIQVRRLVIVLRSLVMSKRLTMVAVAIAIATTAAAQSPAPASPETPIALASQSPTRETDQPARAGAAAETSAAESEQATAAKAPPVQAASASSRQAAIEQQQAAKAAALQPYSAKKAERLFHRIDTVLEGGALRWHPFFENAYAGGGFTLGVGHVNYVSGYNYIDVRGSYTIAGYKRAEVEFVAPRMFNRRAHLSVLGGWREATQVGFYGVGTDSREEDRTNYLFQQPYGSALFTIFPTRRLLMLRGGLEVQSVVAGIR